jgi:uncharacterized protein (TIGR03437 family)
LTLGAATWGEFSCDDIIDQFQVVSGVPGSSTLMSSVQKFSDASAAAVDTAVVETTSLACAANEVQAGGGASCEVRLNNVDADTVDVELEATSASLLMPRSIKVRRGQPAAKFEIAADSSAKQEQVVLSARVGQSSVSEVLTVNPSAARLTVPRKQFTGVGHETRFSVVAPGNMTLAAAGLPEGATFDVATGTFSWEPAESQIGTHRIAFLASNEAGARLDAAVDVEVDSGKPVLSRVVNFASRSSELACSSGSVASVTGRWLAPVDAVAELSGATELGGVQVKVNGEYVPIVMVSREEVSFICPQTEAGAKLNVVLESAGVVVGTAESVAVDVAPGLFSTDASGEGQAAAVIVETGEMASLRSAFESAAPAYAGDLVALRATGVGSELIVRIGGEQAVMKSVQPVEGMAGTYDIVVTVPDAVFAGAQVPVVVEAVGRNGSAVRSNTVTIAIEQ